MKVEHRACRSRIRRNSNKSNESAQCPPPLNTLPWRIAPGTDPDGLSQAVVLRLYTACEDPVPFCVALNQAADQALGVLDELDTSSFLREDRLRMSKQRDLPTPVLFNHQLAVLKSDLRDAAGASIISA